MTSCRLHLAANTIYHIIIPYHHTYHHEHHIRMSAEVMMPISAEALHYRMLYRTMLFELSKPVIISPEIFNEIWPYVDSVYSKLQQELLQAHGTVRVQKYECRLRKSRKSSTARTKNGAVREPTLASFVHGLHVECSVGSGEKNERERLPI